MTYRIIRPWIKEKALGVPRPQAGIQRLPPRKRGASLVIFFERRN